MFEILIEPTTKPEDLNPPEGQLLLVNKPYKWTSFDVVNKLRYHIKRSYKLKKVKVGHAGTLDPLATGLLLICAGKKTKELHLLTGLDKTYTGSFVLGQTTPSFDLETEVDKETPVDHITEEDIHRTAKEMIGKQEQMPPIFSAKKVDGKRAYHAARKGKDIKLTAHPIEIFDFRITAIEMPRIDFEVKCSKGTYIRSIARDFGEKLSAGAHLSELTRTAAGPYLLETAFDLEELVAHLSEPKTPL